MGVPYFFSWLVGKCPKIVSRVETDISVDNFYLDMNHIFHQFKNIKNEQEMFLQIFLYIEELVNMVKPTKYLFFAVDGVCPRTKLNQQRQRRWNLNELSKENFDSKSITPGTEFMTKLASHLQYFIRRKLQDDKNWTSIEFGVFFSDSNQPGEGEHKIIDFMRENDLKSKEMTHCIYGMDSDLIMIGLATHEQNVILLRESNNKNFELLHISILRNYIDVEFSKYFKKSTLEYQLERIIDDFILMLFLCGNDFLPSIPTLDIHEGALNSFFEIYKELLMEDKLKNYIVNSEKDEIDIQQLKLFVKELSKFEKKNLENSLKNQNFFKNEIKIEKEVTESIPLEEPEKEEELFEKSSLNSKFVHFLFF
jgi:5'-3' exoribonuclease 1